MKRNWKIFKRLLKKNTPKLSVILVVLSFFTTVPFLAQLVRNFTDLYNIIILIYLLFLLYSLYYLFSYFLKKGVSVKNEKGHRYLKYWIEGIGYNDPISETIVTDEEKNSVFENLIHLKLKILEYCEDNEEKLRLLRSYYSTIIDNDKKFVWQTIIGFIIIVAGYFIRVIILDESVLELFGAVFSTFDLILLVLALIIFISKDILTERNKLLLIYKIINELIELKENEKKYK
ncbi:hypothetical protein [Bacillus suaedae]|uniref:Uncharacterized protein n=1 Tax=Halalkalibacter suaedae TaxID=2822140 RepID=A0A941APP0_9BACI|nr:hypothetical protein [Bacillus suaedae]MBP3950323.1 hypothetical protein [Bacillus suaedae]